MAAAVHPVDQILPVPKLLTLGLQHVLVMYAGAVAVPLIVGRALNLSPQDMAILISADLFACGNGARSSTEARVAAAATTHGAEA